MTDGEALLRGVLAEPFCNVPRLVYADWLEENGEPERAEFIRAHIEASEYEKTSRRRHTCKCDGSNTNCEPCRDESKFIATQDSLLKLFKSFTPKNDYHLRLADNGDGSIHYTGQQHEMKTINNGFVTHITFLSMEAFDRKFAEYFEKYPIQSVSIVDKHPVAGILSNSNSGRFSFAKYLNGNRPYTLSYDVFNEMELTWCNSRPGFLEFIHFMTYPEAIEALSRTLVNYARVRVGLERLKFPAYA